MTMTHMRWRQWGAVVWALAFAYAGLVVAGRGRATRLLRMGLAAWSCPAAALAATFAFPSARIAQGGRTVLFISQAGRGARVWHRWAGVVFVATAPFCILIALGHDSLMLVLLGIAVVPLGLQALRVRGAGRVPRADWIGHALASRGGADAMFSVRSYLCKTVQPYGTSFGMVAATEQLVDAYERFLGASRVDARSRAVLWRHERDSPCCRNAAGGPVIRS